MIVSCARALLSLLLPSDARTMIVRDLDDEYARFILPSRSRPARQPGIAARSSVLSCLRSRCAGGAGRSGPRSVALALDGIWRDIRLAIRLAARQKSFTLAVLMTLGLGIGATTAVFSVVDPVLVRPLPYTDPFELVRVWSANPRGISAQQCVAAGFLRFSGTGPTARRPCRFSHRTVRPRSSFSVNRPRRRGGGDGRTWQPFSVFVLCSAAGSHRKRPGPTRQSSS